MTFETLISRWDDYNSFLKFLVRLYLSLHLYVCVCAFHWFAEIYTADVYVEVKKKISVRVIFLTLFLAVWMGVQRYYFLAGSLHGMFMSCKRVVYRLACGVIKVLVRKLS